MNTIISLSIDGKSVQHPYNSDKTLVIPKMKKLVLILDSNSSVPIFDGETRQGYWFVGGAFFLIRTVKRKIELPSCSDWYLIGDQYYPEDQSILRTYVRNYAEFWSSIDPDLIGTMLRLARPDTVVYYIPVPSLELGSVSVDLTEDLVPILVPPEKALERLAQQQ